MFDHQRNDLIVAEILFPDFQFAINGFAGPQQFARLDTDFPDQAAQLLSG
jgi:hypothetical protein